MMELQNKFIDTFYKIIDTLECKGNWHDATVTGDYQYRLAFSAHFNDAWITLYLTEEDIKIEIDRCGNELYLTQVIDKEKKGSRYDELREYFWEKWEKAVRYDVDRLSKGLDSIVRYLNEKHK